MYVYLLQSVNCPNQRYIGSTKNLRHRLSEHNSGKSIHTAKFKPWKVMVAVWFEDEKKALEFERYLKIGSGRAFARRRLW